MCKMVACVSSLGKLWEESRNEPQKERLVLFDALTPSRRGGFEPGMTGAKDTRWGGVEGM